MDKITMLSKTLHSLRESHAEASDALKEIAAKRDDAESALIDAMVEEGVKSISVQGLGLFTFTTKNYLSVNAANKPQFYAYLQESGNGDLLRLDVNPKTLTAFLREHLDGLIAQKEQDGLDSVTAREVSLKFLNERGASYFSERGISVRKS